MVTSSNVFVMVPVSFLTISGIGVFSVAAGDRAVATPTIQPVAAALAAPSDSVISIAFVFAPGAEVVETFHLPIAIGCRALSLLPPESLPGALNPMLSTSKLEPRTARIVRGFRMTT